MQISRTKIAILTDPVCLFSVIPSPITNGSAVNTTLLDRGLGFFVMKGTELCFHFSGGKWRLVSFQETDICHFLGISQGEKYTRFKSSLASLLLPHRRGRAGRNFRQLIDKYIDQKLVDHDDLYLDITMLKLSVCTAMEQNPS